MFKFEDRSVFDYFPSPERKSHCNDIRMNPNFVLDSFFKTNETQIDFRCKHINLQDTDLSLKVNSLSQFI